MNRFDVIRIVTDVMEERGYTGNFNISYISDHIIVIVMTMDDRNVSKVLLMDDIEMCREPRYMIRHYINEMINQIRSGGTIDDQEC